MSLETLRHVNCKTGRHQIPRARFEHKFQSRRERGVQIEARRASARVKWQFEAIAMRQTLDGNFHEIFSLFLSASACARRRTSLAATAALPRRGQLSTPAASMM